MIILRWLLSAALVMLVGTLVPGIQVANFWTALVVALVLGFLNAVIRPILIILTLPVTILTLGLFTLVINAGLFMLAGSIVKGYYVHSFSAALLGSLLLWLLNWAVSGLTRKK